MVLNVQSSFRCTVLKPYIWLGLFSWYVLPVTDMAFHMFLKGLNVFCRETNRILFKKNCKYFIVVNAGSVTDNITGSRQLRNLIILYFTQCYDCKYIYKKCSVFNVHTTEIKISKYLSIWSSFFSPLEPLFCVVRHMPYELETFTRCM